MSHKNIVLVGFMGAGKTIVSKKLAGELDRERISTDEVIEEREQCSISDIFVRRGEPSFRKIEAEVVAELRQLTDRVIDCGGGVILNEGNIVNLRQNGILFYLKASPRVIYERTKDAGGRPILDVSRPLETIGELMAQREPHYRKADCIIEVDTLSVDEIIREIIGLST